MFPIRDHNPTEGRPVVTIALIAVNIALFLLTAPWGGGMDWLWVQGALYPVAVMHGEHVWGLVTHMFLHAGPMHLAGNMLFLWIFGDNLEEQMGPLGFLAFYLCCGLAAAAAQISADPSSGVPMVGASGAIAGVMGGYLLLFPRARVDILLILFVFIRVFSLPAWVMLALWFGLQLFSGYASIGGDAGVAYWAHAGGFVAGVLLAMPLFLRRGGAGFWALTRGRPPHPAADYAASRIPRGTR